MKGLSERESCDSMATFYSCTNGFVGCCSIDPCGPNNNCPVVQSSSTTSVSHLSTASSTHHSTTKTTDLPASSTGDRASDVNSSLTTNSEKGTALISTASGSLTVASISRTSTHYTSVPTSVPSCPAGDGTVFTDTSGIAYIIHCNMDNSYSSDDAVQVSMGGYSECFSACSSSRSCAGFTYVGLSDGDCYLKSQLPKYDYVEETSSNYTTCAKVNATAVALSAIPGQTGAATSKSSAIGTIVGGVVGGVASVAFVLLITALIARYRQNKFERRGTTVTHVDNDPIEATEMISTSPTHPHGEFGSTAQDAFATFECVY